MPIELELFLTFFYIGLFTFGGGYAMIPIVRQEVLNRGWLDGSEEMVSNMIAVSESTPGPIAINMATFVGSDEAGFLGSVCATLGVVLPSFLVILLIAAVLKNFEKNKYFKAIVNGIKPVVSGLITATGLLLFVKCWYVNFGDFTTAPSVSVPAIITIAILGVAQIISFIWRKKQIPPILLIVVSAGIGMLLF